MHNAMEKIVVYEMSKEKILQKISQENVSFDTWEPPVLSLSLSLSLRSLIR
jgi:hypothetical protein